MSKKTDPTLPKITIADDLRRQAESHCFSAVDHEVGGFLAGTLKDGETVIEGVIPSTKAKSDQANLTFTHESWDEAYAVLHEKFPDKALVGWYHSHPGYGVFLSDYDAFIQHNFFSNIGHVALVIDPLAAETGWFVSRDGEIVTVQKEATQREALKPANRDEDGKPKVIAAQRSGRQNPLVLVMSAILIVLSGAVGYVVGTSNAPERLIPTPEPVYSVMLDDAAAAFWRKDEALFASIAGTSLMTLQTLNPKGPEQGFVLLPTSSFQFVRSAENLRPPAVTPTPSASSSSATNAPTASPSTSPPATPAPKPTTPSPKPSQPTPSPSPSLPKLN